MTTSELLDSLSQRRQSLIKGHHCRGKPLLNVHLIRQEHICERRIGQESVVGACGPAALMLDMTGAIKLAVDALAGVGPCKVCSRASMRAIVAWSA